QTIVSRSMDITQNPSVVTVGKFTGGVRFNIIPEQAELVGTIRALHPDDRKKIHDLVRRTATNIAEAMGATVEVQVPATTAYPVTFNNVALTNAMLPTLQAVAGADKVQLIKPQTGAEDFSFFADKVPGLYISLGGRAKDKTADQVADHHTPDFFIDDSGLGLGVKAMTAMTLNYMRTNPRPTP
ncbi:MAG: M20/M25/M40 family metallo-hydrolase, partial [Gemmatimonadaceae bacterium]